MAAVLKAIGGFLKKALEKGAKGVAKKKATEVATKNAGKVIAIIICIVSFLMISALLPIIGPISFAYSLNNYLLGAKYANLTEEEYNNVIDDAGLLREYIWRMGTDGYTSNMLGIDKKTVLRILDAVAEYNYEINRDFTIEYRYRTEYVPVGTSFPDMDTIYENGTGIITDSVENIDGYEVDYDGKDKVVVSRKGIETQEYIHNTSQSIFRVRWQPIVALCCMKIIENADNWGSYTVVDGKLESGKPNYYLSDKEIDEIISIFVYEFEFERDIGKDGEIGYCEFEEFMNSKSYGFELNVGDWQKTKDGKFAIRTTRRIPRLAPSLIKNSYISYEYIYENVEAGGYSGSYLSKRKITVEPQNLIAAMKRQVSSYDNDWFLLCLEQLPLTEDMCVFYRDLLNNPDNYFSEGKTELVGYGNRVFVFGNTYSGPLMERPEGGMTIPLYYGNWEVSAKDKDGNTYYYTIYLEPASWLIKDGQNWGEYIVEPEAIMSLSAGMDVAGIDENGGYKAADMSSMEKLVDYCYEKYPNWPVFLVEGDLSAEQKAAILDVRKQKLALCLHDFQVEHHCSITGFFGIMKQEGTLESTWTSRRWNFFNITRGDLSIPGIVNSSGEVTAFRDYKKWCENETTTGYKDPVINAFDKQMEWVWNNYWNDGQDTYFSMIFNGYNINDPNTWPKVHHSYCPPWDDPAMPFSANSHVGGAYYWKSAGKGNRGWVNGCALAKREFMDAIWEDSTSSIGNKNPNASPDTFGKTNFNELKPQVIE